MLYAEPWVHKFDEYRDKGVDIIEQPIVPHCSEWVQECENARGYRLCIRH